MKISSIELNEVEELNAGDVIFCVNEKDTLDTAAELRMAGYSAEVYEEISKIIIKGKYW